MRDDKATMHYQVAMPYFSEEDIAWIQEKTKEVLTGRLSTGPFVDELEQKFAKFIGTKYAVCVNSCTSALEISLKVLGLKNNDEVIVPAETFIATGMAVTLNGGKVIFAEVDPETFCLSLNEIKSRMTRKTTGVMLVHFGGYMSPDTLQIQKFCRKNGLFLIEDAAHSHGASIGGEMSGAIGDTGCFSFFPTKIMTMGEGGILTTDKKWIYKQAMSLRERGRSLHSKTELYSYDWRSCRVPEISALVGLSQFSHLREWVALRNRIAAIYNTEFEASQDISTLKVPKNVQCAYWKHITVINHKKVSRVKLAQLLRSKYKISINWAYDPPIHLQPIYRKMYGHKKGFLPITEDIMSRHFHLPMHVQLTEKDAQYVAVSVLKAVNELKK